SVCGIDDVRATFPDTLEHDKVTEVPVEDASRLQVLEILDLDSDAASAQSVVTRDVQNGECRRAVAPTPERSPHIIDANDFAVKSQDHRQARGAALGFCQLTYDGDAAGRTRSAEAPQRWKGLNE